MEHIVYIKEESHDRDFPFIGNIDSVRINNVCCMQKNHGPYICLSHGAAKALASYLKIEKEEELFKHSDDSEELSDSNLSTDDVKPLNVKIEKEDMEFEREIPDKVEFECTEMSETTKQEEDKQAVTERATPQHEMKEKKHKCTECQYQTDSLQHLKFHHRVHTGERPFPCNICSYRAKVKSALLTHIRCKHMIEKPYKCQLCTYRCATPSALKRHMERHQLLKRFVCDLCDYATTTADRLRSHKYNRHLDKTTDEGIKDKILKCSHCHYQTVFPHNLERHIRNHTGERLFACDQCDYQGKEKGDLKMHVMFRHNSEKPYQCGLCPYRGVILNSLRKHMLTHQLLKPFVCEYCNKGFNTKQGYRRHMFRHMTNEKPLKCEFCSYSTYYASDLNSHKKNMHSEGKRERTVKCELCDYTCFTDYLLKRHMFVHTKDKPYKCSECSFQTLGREKLVKHINSKHK